MISHPIETLVSLCALGILLIFTPFLALLLVAVNLILLLAHLALQFYAVSFPIYTTKETLSRQPFISIHVPTYTEPPRIVIETLKSIQSMHYSNYEVIIIDNNTVDRGVWKPVETYCKSDKCLKFFHFENVSGFKGGALDISLKKTSPSAQFIAVIDADYKVQANFAQEAVAHFTDERLALVQFPQAYYNKNDDNNGLVTELMHFFLFYLNMSNYSNSVTSTGTMSVYRKKALESVGGWQSRSITEDAEIGLKLILSGYQTRYVNKVLGRGLLPYDLDSLKKQRDRWIFGNMQLLANNWRHILLSNLSKPQKLSLLSQLTAWFNFLLIPSIMLLSYFFNSPLYSAIAITSSASVIIYLTGKLAIFIIGFRNYNYSFTSILNAYLTHLGMVWEGSLSWVACIINSHYDFIRTNKFERLSGFNFGFLPNVVMVLAGLAIVLQVLSQSVFLAIAPLLIAFVYALILYVHHQITYSEVPQ